MIAKTPAGPGPRALRAAQGGYPHGGGALPCAVLRPSRRELLRVGLLGSLALACGGLLAAGSGRIALAQGAEPAGFFRLPHLPLARAVIRAFLAGVLPAARDEREAAVERSVIVADRYFAAFSPAVQGEAQQALDLLGLAPVRWALLRSMAGWDEAAAEDVAAFLERLRTSRLHTLRQIFLLLEGVATVGWYGQPAAWAAIGYPGPRTVPRPAGDAPL